MWGLIKKKEVKLLVDKCFHSIYRQADTGGIIRLTKKSIKTSPVISTPIHLFSGETGEKSSCTELEIRRFHINI